MIAIEWENLSVAGAFLLGAILATIATLRVMRLTSHFLTEIQRQAELSEAQRGKTVTDRSQQCPPPS